MRHIDFEKFERITLIIIILIIGIKNRGWSLELKSKERKKREKLRKWETIKSREVEDLTTDQRKLKHWNYGIWEWQWKEGEGNFLVTVFFLLQNS